MKPNKIIKTGYYILKNRLFDKRIPLSVIFSVTNKCNFNCKHCNIWKDTESELSTEQIYLLFDELAEMGTQNISIFGGEPLLRKDIGKIIDYGKKKGFFMALSTNAYLAPPIFNEISNVGRLSISFDGSRTINDQLRHKDSYNLIIRSIKLAKKNNIPVNTYTLLMKQNLNQIDFILTKAEELNFKAYFLYLSEEPQAKKTINKFYPKKKQYQEAINKLIAYKASGKPVLNSFEALRYMYDLPNPKTKFKCWAGRLHIHIASDGRIYACSSKRQHNNKGNKFPQTSLKEAFENLYVDEGECKYCICPGLFERNEIFSLNPSIIYGAIKKWTF